MSCNVGDSSDRCRRLCVGGQTGLSSGDDAQGQHEKQNAVNTCCEMHGGA